MELNPFQRTRNRNLAKCNLPYGDQSCVNPQFFLHSRSNRKQSKERNNYLEIMCWWVWMIAKELVQKLRNWRGIWAFQRLPYCFGKKVGWMADKWMFLRVPLGRRWLAVDHYCLSFSVRPTRMNENPTRVMILNAFPQTHAFPLIQEHEGYHNLSQVSSMEVQCHPSFQSYVHEMINDVCWPPWVTLCFHN